jgi:hypothetical protein
MAMALLVGVPRPAAAQAGITSADIQRLQDSIYDASRDVAQARGRDTALASQLQTELDDARDETVYLKVKLRKNEPVTRNDYSDLRDRIDNIRSRARGESSARASGPAPSGGIGDRPAASAPAPAPLPAPAPAPRSASSYDVPVGAEFEVRLQNALSSATAQVEDRFEATTMADVKDGDRVVIPAGSVVRGVVSSVTKAGRVERKGSLTAVFDQVTIRGRNYPIRATVTQAMESEGIRGEAGKLGVGAAVGGILGGILGGGKGALAGILIGGGGTMAATEGKDIELPPGTVLKVRLDSGLSLR